MENTIIKRLEKGNDIGVDTCFYFDNDLEINRKDVENHKDQIN